MSRRIQAVLLAIAIVVMAVLVVGPYRDLRTVDSAAAHLEVLSEAARRFENHTGQPCEDIHGLWEDPGVHEWRGPYIESEDALIAPWGGRFVINAERGLIGLDAGDDRVPEKYRLGGIAELSMPSRDDPDWWTSDAVVP